jgi:aspartyl-tRNA(Asn)/glutamyl-tRNA(Gln) amidotransferase subunit A
MTIREIGKLLRGRKASCVELVRQTFAEIKQRDKCNSFITLTEESAVAEAAERDRELAAGRDRGAFHGVPIAHKDLFYTKGTRTTGGSLVYRDFVPNRDATVVSKLREAGAISVGKTNLHELAYGITSKNPHYGPVLNPLDTKRIPGGSSGGSASAVGQGFVPMCLGTDTGGSIRIPASYCGIVGIKPSYGGVSRYGVLPLAFSLDHVGPLASSVEDCALTMDVIAGFDANDPASAEAGVNDFGSGRLQDLKGVRVGVPDGGYFDRVAPGVLKRVNEAIATMRRLGATVMDVHVPDLTSVNAAALVVQLAEAAAVYVNHANPAEFGENVWALLEQGKLIAGHEYVNAQRLRTIYRTEFDAVWGAVDVLATPTTPITAPLLDETTVEIGAERDDVRMASTRLVRAINYLGYPALSMPCGKAENDMPASLQLIAKPFAERRLLEIARVVEAAVGFTQ